MNKRRLHPPKNFLRAILKHLHSWLTQTQRKEGCQAVMFIRHFLIPSEDTLTSFRTWSVLQFYNIPASARLTSGQRPTIKRSELRHVYAETFFTKPCLSLLEGTNPHKNIITSASFLEHNSNYEAAAKGRSACQQLCPLLILLCPLAVACQHCQC